MVGIAIGRRDSQNSVKGGESEVKQENSQRKFNGSSVGNEECLRMLSEAHRTYIKWLAKNLFYDCLKSKR